MRRLLTALVLVALVVPAVVFLPSLGLLLVVVVTVELAAAELVPILRRLVPDGPFRVLFVLVAAAILALTWRGEAGVASAWLFGVVLVVVPFAAVIVGTTPIERSALGAALLSLSTAYLTLPAVALYRLHQLDDWLVFLALAVVVVQDSLAFYCGRAFGSHPLAPQASPNKTWEGSVAGFLGAMAVVAIWCYAVRGGIEWPWLVLGACVAVAGQLGDLAESVLKRGAGVKDSGTVLPGHGGVLDRIDALLFASPVLYAGVLLITG